MACFIQKKIQMADILSASVESFGDHILRYLRHSCPAEHSVRNPQDWPLQISDLFSLYFKPEQASVKTHPFYNALTYEIYFVYYFSCICRIELNFSIIASLKTGSMKSSRKIVNSSWTFLTNHAHVLMCLAKNPSERIRDIAVEVGITERAVQRIIVELEEDGYLDHIRDGRRNVYKVFSRKPLRHCIEKHRQVHDLINLIKK